MQPARRRFSTALLNYLHIKHTLPGPDIDVSLQRSSKATIRSSVHPSLCPSLTAGPCSCGFTLTRLCQGRPGAAMQNWEMKHFSPFPLAGLRENKKRKKIQMPRELIAIFSSCIFAHKRHAPNSSLSLGHASTKKRLRSCRRSCLSL